MHNVNYSNPNNSPDFILDFHASDTESSDLPSFQLQDTSNKQGESKIKKGVAKITGLCKGISIFSRGSNKKQVIYLEGDFQINNKSSKENKKSPLWKKLNIFGGKKGVEDVQNKEEEQHAGTGNPSMFSNDQSGTATTGKMQRIKELMAKVNGVPAKAISGIITKIKRNKNKDALPV